MKKMITIIASTVLAGSLAFAASKRSDKAQQGSMSDGTETHEVDTSKNPITGTTTTTETYEKSTEGQHGKTSVEVTDKTKQKKDGQVSKETDIEADSTGN